MPRRLILASASPRRRELLARLGIPFEVIASGADEEVPEGIEPAEAARRLALDKALSALPRAGRDALVLAADTIVAAKGDSGPVILGKPADAEEARRMLRALSGRAHRVITGVAVAPGGQALVDSEETVVRFRELTESEIDRCVDSGESCDKAGAYGIQGAAAQFVEEVEGDYYNVVGLPLGLVRRLLLPHFPDVLAAPPPPPALPFPLRPRRE